MTYSICVREPYRDADGDDQTRFGVAVATRLPAVGSMCPFVSADGALATQGVTDERLGRKGLAYLADGLRIDDALSALLAADDAAATRQVHGVGTHGAFVHSGDDCRDWFGHRAGEGYTAAGNLLADEAVLDGLVAGYRENERDAPLARRLVTALAAGERAGGDRRDLPVGSAAVAVETTEERGLDPFYDDLRVDASESPVADLRETYRLAKRGYEAAVERYATD